MNHKALSALALMASVGVAVPASAQEVSRRVSYVDLDLSRPAGVVTLHRRIEGAVRDVCGEVDPRNLHMNRLVLQCRRETRMRTDGQIALAVDQARNLARQSVASAEIAER